MLRPVAIMKLLGLLSLISLLTLLTVLPGGCSEKDRCTNSSCAPPFPHCAEVTGACEAVARQQGAYYKHAPYHLDWDRQIDVACNEDGLYPFSDCHSFYLCQDGVATLRTCDHPGYPYFDPVLQRCSPTKSCPHFDCYDKHSSKVGLLGRRSSFFAYCFKPELYYTMSVSRDANIHIISRCYGMDIFDSGKGRCVPRCLREGLIPDTSDCHSYFLCSLLDPVDNVFNMTKLSCPQGHGFLSSEFRCVPEADVPSCGETYAKPI